MTLPFQYKTLNICRTNDCQLTPFRTKITWFCNPTQFIIIWRNLEWWRISIVIVVPHCIEFQSLLVENTQFCDQWQVGYLSGCPSELEDDDECCVEHDHRPSRHGGRTTETGRQDEGENQWHADCTLKGHNKQHYSQMSQNIKNWKYNRNTINQANWGIW